MGIDPISLTAGTVATATAAATAEAAAAAAATTASGIAGGATGAFGASMGGLGTAGGAGALESLMATSPAMFGEGLGTIGAPITGAEALGGTGAGAADFMGALATPPSFGMPELAPGMLGNAEPSWMASMQGKLGGLMADPQVRAGMAQGGLAMMSGNKQPQRASPPPMMGQMPGAGSIGSPGALGSKPMMGGPGGLPGGGQSMIAARMRGLGR
jgi:hypothetical protein